MNLSDDKKYLKSYTYKHPDLTPKHTVSDAVMLFSAVAVAILCVITLLYIATGGP